MRTYNSRIGSLVADGSLLTPEQMAALRDQLPEEEKYNLRIVVCCLGDKLVRDETIAEMAELMDYVAARRLKGLPLVAKPGLAFPEPEMALSVGESGRSIKPGDGIVRIRDGKSGVVVAARGTYVYVLYAGGRAKTRVRRSSVEDVNYYTVTAR